MTVLSVKKVLPELVRMEATRVVASLAAHGECVCSIKRRDVKT